MKFGTWGSSWSSFPIPCPTYERTTENPSDSTHSWIAFEISKILFPGFANLIPRSSELLVTSKSFDTLFEIVPTPKVKAESE